MKIVILLLFVICSAQAQRLRGLAVESLEVEMQLETLTPEQKKQQIQKALRHDHGLTTTNAEVLETVLETGEYPKPLKKQSLKTTEELIKDYLDADPTDSPIAGQSSLSKGDTSTSLGQPGTLGVHGGGSKDTVAESEKKSKVEEDDDDDEEGGPHKDGQTPNIAATDATTTAPSLSPTLEGTSSGGADFTAQDNIVAEVSVVTVSLKHAAFLYKRTSLEAPSDMDLSRLAIVTNTALLEMFTHIFTNVISADYISMDITKYEIIRDDFVDFKVNVYFNGDSAAIPDAQQLSEIAAEELSSGTKHYDQYLKWLQQSDSHVIASTQSFVFVTSQAEIDALLAGEVPVETETNSGTKEEKTNHMIPLIILGFIISSSALWFWYRRRAHEARPQRGHNLMKLKGDRDDSTVATYRTTVYTEEALKKARASEKGPTMEELEEISIGDDSDSSSSISMPNSPVSTNGLSAKSMKNIAKGLKKPSWASRSVAGSELSSVDADDSVSTQMFTTPVSIADTQDEAPKPPPLKPVTYEFSDTPRSRIPRKKYSKADVRLMEECSDDLDIKMHKRPVVTYSSQTATDPSLTIPDLKMKDLMVDTSMESPQPEKDCDSVGQPNSCVEDSALEHTPEETEDPEASASSESLPEEEKEAILFACKTFNAGRHRVESPDPVAADSVPETESDRKNLDEAFGESIGNEKVDGSDTQSDLNDEPNDEAKDSSKEDNGKMEKDEPPPPVRTLKMKRGSTYMDPSDLPEWMRKFKQMGLDKTID